MLPERETHRSMSVLVGATIAWLLIGLVALVFAALAVRTVVWLVDPLVGAAATFAYPHPFEPDTPGRLVAARCVQGGARAPVLCVGWPLPKPKPARPGAVL